MSSEATAVPKSYGRSVHTSAIKAAWHASRVFAVVTIVNAILQALILLPAPTYGYETALFIVLGVISGIILILSLGLILGAALNSGIDNSFSGAVQRIRPHFWKFVLWTLIWMVVTVIGSLLYIVPGFIILAATPYVLFAAIEGKRNPLMSNFRAIGGRKGRYIVVLIVTFIVLWLLFIASGLINFTVSNPWAGLIQWLYVGFFGCWLVSGWALMWRSTGEGAVATN